MRRLFVIMVWGVSSYCVPPPVTPPNGWVRIDIPAVDLSIDVVARAPLHTEFTSAKGHLDQTLRGPDTFIFLDYGPDWQLDAYVRSQNDFLHTARVTSDEWIHVADVPARRVTLTITAAPVRIYRVGPSGLDDESRASSSEVVVVIEFAHRDVPVLVGYRVPDDAPREAMSVAERVVKSVRSMSEGR